MTDTPYAFRLAGRLLEGTQHLPATLCRRQRRYVQSLQKGDGGFGGRRGPSDIYYTSFALRAARLVGVTSTGFFRTVARYLRGAAPELRDLTDVFSLVISQALIELAGETLWCEACRDERLAAVHAVLDRFRASDAGYSKTPGGTLSCYHTFLGALTRELLGERLAAADKACELIIGHQASDGGFSDDLGPGPSGTNQTTAALGILSICDRLEESTVRPAFDFFTSMQRPDGGFAAHAAAPACDLLSTFTVLVTLTDVDHVPEEVRLGDVGRFVKGVLVPTGGFRATTHDDEPDIEYTYYGLGAIGLLARYVAG